jgi:ABC-type polysaccharide/polyol phosphate export permease
VKKVNIEPNQEFVFYEPNQRLRIGFFRSCSVMFMNIVKSRELIWELFKRDFFAGYKQSFLGILWIFVSPVVGILSWVFLNMTGVLNPGEVDIPYPVYVLVGSTVWGFFMSCYSAAAGSLSGGSSLILQVNFPHEALVVKGIANAIAGFLISLSMVMAVLLVFGVYSTLGIAFFALTLIPILLLGVGLGMVVTVTTVVAHDVSKIVTMGLGFLMFLTPVIYTPQVRNNFLQSVIRWNPLSYLIGGARDIVLWGRIPNFDGYVLSCSTGLAIFLLSWRLFFLSEYKVAEKL